MIGDDEERVVKTSGLTVENRILRPTDEPSPGGSKGHGQADRDVLLAQEKPTFMTKLPTNVHSTVVVGSIFINESRV